MTLASDTDGHWLAGYVNGDGTFGLVRQPQKGWMSFHPSFQIVARKDDLRSIEEARRILGVGKIHHVSKRSDRRRGRASVDQFMLTVQSTAACYHVLVPFFNKYPLRGKKQLVFEAWAEGVSIKYYGHHRTKAGLKALEACRRRIDKLRKANVFA